MSYIVIKFIVEKFRELSIMILLNVLHVRKSINKMTRNRDVYSFNTIHRNRLVLPKTVKQGIHNMLLLHLNQIIE